MDEEISVRKFGIYSCSKGNLAYLCFRSRKAFHIIQLTADSTLGLWVGLAFFACDLHRLTPNLMASSARASGGYVQLQSVTGNV